MSDSWRRDQDLDWTIAAVRQGFSGAIDAGATLDAGTIEARLVPSVAAGPPYVVELNHLRFRDPRSSRRFTVLYRFSESKAEILLAGQSGEVIETIAATDSFLPSEAIFPVTRVRVAEDSAVFLTQYGEEYTHTDLPPD